MLPRELSRRGYTSFEGGKFYFEGLKSGRVRILTRGAALRLRSVPVVNLESALPDAIEIRVERRS